MKADRTTAPLIGRGSERVLFVEAQTRASLDVKALTELLGGCGVRVVPAGGCDGVLGALGAMRQADAGGGRCFGILDRDHRADDEVGATWEGGPFGGDRTYVYWHRHEIENYLIDPGFVHHAAGLRCTVDDIWDALLAEAQRRVYVDAANLAIKAVREQLSTAWNVKELEPSSRALETERGVEAGLLGHPGWQAVRTVAEDSTSVNHVRDRYRAFLDTLFGGADHSDLTRDQGAWLDRMAGKGLIGTMLSDRHFDVRAHDGASVTGAALRHHLAVDLMRRFDEIPEDDRPPDLVAVRDYFRDAQP